MRNFVVLIFAHQDFRLQQPEDGDLADTANMQIVKIVRNIIAVQKNLMCQFCHGRTVGGGNNDHFRPLGACGGQGLYDRTNLSAVGDADGDVILGKGVGSQLHIQIVIDGLTQDAARSRICCIYRPATYPPL